MKPLMMFILTALSCNCAFAQPVAGKQPPAEAPACHIIFDAGSSGTRLYVYERQGSQWIPHAGPKVGALADPVREIRGKTWHDAEAVTDEVVQALDDIKREGPDNGHGKPAWSAFDWSTQCAVASAKVFATAGMRLAEQGNRPKSNEIWDMLEQKLQAKLGMAVTTRTLTGYEEGLYAWLAIREEKPNPRFGLVEMGGASSQVTFPCKACEEARVVQVQGEPVRLYSYSFLGLGQDVAFDLFGGTPECAHGVGLTQPAWTPEKCAAHISINTPQGIRDPYNFGPDGLGAYNDIPTGKADIGEWVLTGAFQFMKASDIDNYCRNDVDGFNAVASCFRSVYQPEYLDSLGVSPLSNKDEASWTLGAVICEATDCLQETGTLPCRWSGEGCL